MSKLIITKGLPASGKTTWAKAWCGIGIGTPCHRINKDDLRAMLHDGRHSSNNEDAVIRARNAMARAFLEVGHDVIVDDTNLAPFHERNLSRLAMDCGATFEIKDFTDIGPDVCIERDALRPKPVGADVIRLMYNKYLERNASQPQSIKVEGKMTSALPQEMEKAPAYDPALPDAVLCDLDGTLCINTGRSPYDESRVSEDLPNKPVVELVQTLMNAGVQVIGMSGRTEACRGGSYRWLQKNVGPIQWLHMRRIGDRRKDSIVKYELYNSHIRGKYNVRFVLDDRQQVVDMWRALGLTCLQVAPGNF